MANPSHGDSLVGGKRALVIVPSGCDTALADAVAERLAAEGAIAVVAGGKGEVPFDGRPGSVAGALADAASRLGGLDAIVVACGSTWVGPVGDVDDTTLAALVTANLGVPVKVAALAVEVLADGGTLTMLTTVWSMATSAEMGITGASLAGLAPLTKSVALSGGARRLRANLVALGVVDTPEQRAVMHRRNPEAASPAAALDAAAARCALGRPATADEVAKVVAYLVSDRSRHTTGTTVLVDGGLLLT